MNKKDGDGKRILLVENDKDVREALAECLAHFDFSVLTARNGREALQLLKRKSHLPDAIVLDLIMPVMSGYEFYEEQRGDPNLKKIPVIVLSAASKQNAAGKGCLEGVKQVFEKPVDLAGLVSCLTNAICESPVT
jgi:CheY-like chemotaxis protein